MRRWLVDARRGGFARTGLIEAAGPAVYRAPHGMSALLPAPGPPLPR